MCNVETPRRHANLVSASHSSQLHARHLDLSPLASHRQRNSTAPLRAGASTMSHLANPLATRSQLYLRSELSPLPQDVEESVFIATQCLTQAAGQLLRYSQAVTAQANVILARYWLVASPMEHEFSDLSAAAIYLIGKLGPKPRAPRDVANVYAYLLSDAPDSALFRTDQSAKAVDAESCYCAEADYFDFSKRLMALEHRICVALSFDTHVSLPHPIAITYLQTFHFFSRPKSEASLRTMQYLNTALLSPQMLYLTHQPHALAVAAIYNAARDLGAKLPECAWWEVFDVDREELGFLVVAMRSLEGLLRKRKEEFPEFRQRMLTRDMVEKKLEQDGRPLPRKEGAMADEEAAIMRRMDQR
ncbi:hypothetical protein RJ55_06591 [Drechmeria coniospora]|nr:hypothetical protein RJ55_06591 [Drechmeria coniospora]